MDRKRITVPADRIKKRCICRQCGQERYEPESIHSIRERDISANSDNDKHFEQDYPHPDTWEP